MSEQLNNSHIGDSYATSSGQIRYTLKSDLLFHYVMQKSKNSLLNLVCALKSLSPDDVTDIHIENPIDFKKVTGKQTTMDIKLTLNHKETLNIELQMYMDKYWIDRSILYLCRAFDCLGKGDDYMHLKPTTQICITNQNLFPEHPEFYGKYMITNIKTHHFYSNIFCINVLQLNHTDLATTEDIENILVYWAKVFKATTWEQLQDIIKERPEFTEVGAMIHEVNTDPSMEAILEAERRYDETIATMYHSGYDDATEKLAPRISGLESEVSALKKLLTENGIDIPQK